MKKEVPFKESRMIKTTVLLIVIGAMFSIIPEGNPVVLVFNLSLALIAGILFYVFWKKTKHQSKRYYSLLSFVMLNVLAIYFAMPLLRMYFLTFTFWVGIISLLIMNTLPYLYSRNIARGVQKPTTSSLGKIYVIYATLILCFGISAYMNALYMSHSHAIVIAILAFLFSILFFFLSPVLLIKPKDMDQLTKE